MKKLAIFASGSGSNAENIARYFQDNEDVQVNLILCNKSTAGVLERAEKLGLESMVFNREDFSSDEIVNVLKSRAIDLIVLAGFLWLIPRNLIKAFPNRIINIHPALLPKYGGKGMYGHHVHNAVLRNQEKYTGISIHYVNENYDEGSIIFQASVNIEAENSPDGIASQVHELEYKYYPQVIEEILSKNEI